MLRNASLFKLPRQLENNWGEQSSGGETCGKESASGCSLRHTVKRCATIMVRSILAITCLVSIASAQIPLLKSTQKGSARLSDVQIRQMKPNPHWRTTKGRSVALRSGLRIVKPSKQTGHRREQALTYTEGQSLLDAQASLRMPIANGVLLQWRKESVSRHIEVLNRARALVRLGEYRLGDHEPGLAFPLFQRAASVAPRTAPVYGLAKFDIGLAYYYSGRYDECRDAMGSVLKSPSKGYDRRTALLYMRHSSACARYHASHAAMGIPEPPSLDTLCGAAGLAVCLQYRGMKYDEPTLVAAVRYDGEGSNMNDLLRALPQPGLTGRAVRTDSEGLKALPMPVVAHVEHDHFIAVVKADQSGVTYVCSDCGNWPGGQVHLSWKQWSALSADMYLAVAKAETFQAVALAYLDDHNSLLASTNTSGSIADSLRQCDAVTSNVLL